ncbi:MAG: hypothetical protein KJO07_09245, partial [Deltaproteobacteria bacterium]|nr:hypothetical protein [Deltaproteobacteria bacterium]
ATGSGKHLVVQALAEGKAKVQCEGKSFELELVAPASMQVRLAESGPFKAGDELELFPVITLDGKDSGGKPLDMGRGLRLEGVEWQVTGPLVIAGSGKQSEVGKETIHLGGKSAGKGTIKASWLGLSSELSIELE